MGRARISSQHSRTPDHSFALRTGNAFGTRSIRTHRESRFPALPPSLALATCAGEHKHPRRQVATK
eukprot:scaffold38621_cov30-Tisochrysis_lutea.AAC.1